LVKAFENLQEVLSRGLGLSKEEGKEDVSYLKTISEAIEAINNAKKDGDNGTILGMSPESI